MRAETDAEHDKENCQKNENGTALGCGPKKAISRAGIGHANKDCTRLVAVAAPFQSSSALRLPHWLFELLAHLLELLEGGFGAEHVVEEAAAGEGVGEVGQGRPGGAFDGGLAEG